MAKLETEVNVNSISRISAGTIIKGEIMSPYDIRIDGTFEGKVQTKGRVVIGEKANVLGDIATNENITISDVDENTKYGDSIKKLYSAGILKGDGNGSFRPDDSITRAEAAAILLRVHKNA